MYFPLGQQAKSSIQQIQVAAVVVAIALVLAFAIVIIFVPTIGLRGWASEKPTSGVQEKMLQFMPSKWFVFYA